MKSPPIEQKEQIGKRKRIIPLLFVCLQLQVVIFAISWFPINLINLLADCLHLGDFFSMYIMIIFLVVALVVKPMWLFQSNAFQNAKLKRTCTCIHVSSIFFYIITASGCLFSPVKWHLSLYPSEGCFCPTLFLLSLHLPSNRVPLTRLGQMFV